MARGDESFFGVPGLGPEETDGQKAGRAAGLRDFHFHDLRHPGATMALHAGDSAPIVQALGGWKSEKMMRRYAAGDRPEFRRAAEAVAGNEPIRPSPKPVPGSPTDR